ncbi:Serpentine receptor class r-10 [Caenorhabditis elegans]|uniref:Serpentine receptor class r-10 n=1 Tax=Caenorhabditis elegans TaxID=6239 RepID=O45340_CAEEL|nr:Seven TM Receptor [Caenorhabditis elegans]CAB07345.1 Seven TM Receptor [Caenorhabditis elegans]|eukprot:NP_507071.1 Seven TM Receptor [Caenorhabditis elegans]
MCSSFWLVSNLYAGYVGFFLSITINLLLLFLIFETPKKVFGSYKYLMAAFSVVGIFFSFCDFYMKPHLHITKTSFIVFTDLKLLGYSYFTGQLALATLCSTYGMMITMLAMHFYYRYLSVTSSLYRFFFKNLTIWVIFLTCNSAIWFFCFLVLNSPSPMKDEELFPEFWESYCLKPNEYTYTGPHYYYTDNSTGEWKFHIPSFVAEGYTAGNIAVAFVFLTYFGFQTYNHLNKLEVVASVNFRELQNQLFRTLVVQTIFPTIFLFFPVSCLVVFPVFGVRIGEHANLIMILFSIYPCFEPIVAMCCIKCFRVRITSKCICKGFL